MTPDEDQWSEEAERSLERGALGVVLFVLAVCGYILSVLTVAIAVLMFLGGPHPTSTSDGAAAGMVYLVPAVVLAVLAHLAWRAGSRLVTSDATRAAKREPRGFPIEPSTKQPPSIQ